MPGTKVLHDITFDLLRDKPINDFLHAHQKRPPRLEARFTWPDPQISYRQFSCEPQEKDPLSARFIRPVSSPSSNWDSFLGALDVFVGL